MNMSMRKRRKLRHYIRDDRLHKVKAWAKKYGESAMARVKPDSKGRSLLHLACKHGSRFTLHYLLQLGLDPSALDLQGNIPLHVAAKYIRKYGYSDFVKPLLKAFPSGLYVFNNASVTPKHLLDLWTAKQQPETPVDSPSRYDRESSEDSSWDEKLLDELFDEYGETFGRYEAEGDFEVDEGETYDQWAKRMGEEYHDKRHDTNPYRSAKPQKSARHGSRERRRRQEVHVEPERSIPKQKPLLRQKILYESVCRKLFDRTNLKDRRIGLDDLPWKEQKESNDIITVMLAGIHPDDRESKKKYLRDQQIRWHPDKFQQLYGHQLMTRDKEAVLSIVNHVSQIINGYIQTIN